MFSSSTPDIAIDAINALHSRVLKALFEAAAVDVGASSASPISPTSAGEAAPLFRITLSYVDVSQEHLYDMLALTKYVPGAVACGLRCCEACGARVVWPPRRLHVFVLYFHER